MFETSNRVDRRSIPQKRWSFLIHSNSLTKYGGGPIPEGFKLPSLAKYGGCSDPYEDVTSINMQMVIIGVSDSLE